MPDYVTREELNAAIESLRCVGDQQTINVTQTPGGQVITSTQVIDVGGSDAAVDTSYIAVTYDSEAEEFTVTITNLPYKYINGLNRLNDFADDLQDGNPGGGVEKYIAIANEGATSSLAITKTLTFEKPATSSTATLTLAGNISRAYSNPGVYWQGTAVSNDADTNEVYLIEGTHYAKITFSSDGTYSIAESDSLSQTPTFGRAYDPPFVYVYASINRISIFNAIDTTPGVPGGSTIFEYFYTAPFDSWLIFGYNNSSNGGLKLDEYANRANYDDWQYAARVDIDADNNVNRAFYVDYNVHAPLRMGWTGTFPDNNGNTVNVRNGMIKHVN